MREDALISDPLVLCRHAAFKLIRVELHLGKLDHAGQRAVDSYEDVDRDLEVGGVRADKTTHA